MEIKLPPNTWEKYLERKCSTLLARKPKDYSDLVPSNIPTDPGVYLITAKKGKKEIPYYVGRSTNLQQRLYRNHLMGSTVNARLKKYLISSGEAENVQKAKDYMRKWCAIRWVIEKNQRKRGALEGFVTGKLFPKYGIYEEH